MTLKELRQKREDLAKEMRRLGDEFQANKQEWKDDAQRQQWEKVNTDYDETMRSIDRASAAADVSSRLDALREQEERKFRDDEGGRERRDERQPEGRRRSSRDDDAGDDDERKLSPEARYQREQERRALCMAAWCCRQLGERTTRQMRDACRREKFNPAQRVLNLQLPDTRAYQALQSEFRKHHPTRAIDGVAESRALNTYNFSDGGVLAPDELLRRMEVNMLAFGGMRQVAETMVTDRGGELRWPTADDTSNTGEQVGEAQAVLPPGEDSVDPTFGAVVWNAYKFSSKPILVDYEILEDSVFNLPSLIGGFFGERLGRITNTKYTTGNGAGTAKGITVAASLGVTAASATAIDADEIFRLVHSVDPAYRIGAGFMLHDNVLLALRLLKDGEGQYLWQSGMRDGSPDRLVGYGLTINQDMASSVATGAKTLLFGQLSKYKIRRVRGMRMYRLQERYRDTDQDGFVAMIREDGNLLTAGTAPVKYLQQL
jgi:HK97 family phage major capsid protein